MFFYNGRFHQKKETMLKILRRMTIRKSLQTTAP
jgi:hypothetical protein